MHTKIFSLLFSLISFSTFGQRDVVESRPLNNYGLGVGGISPRISFNYERLFKGNDNLIISGQLGVGELEISYLCLNFSGGPSNCPPSELYFTIPHHLSANFGKGRHFFEIGIGGTAIVDYYDLPYIIGPIMGYRILPLNKGKINFRIYGSLPFTGYDTGGFIYIPIGLNLGLSI